MSTPKQLKLDILNQELAKVGEKELNPAIFGVEINQGLVHQAVVAQMANARTVLAHAKDRSEVKGGGKKPWRQKGTGRARAGSIRSPLWKGGGATFGPTKDRNFSQKINKKMRRKAVFMCLSDRVNDKRLVLLDKLENKEGKTKATYIFLNNLVSKLYPKELEKQAKKLKETKKLKNGETKGKEKGVKAEDEQLKVKTQKKLDKFSILIILDKADKNIVKASRNIPGIKVDTAQNLNVVDILKYKYLLIMEPAVKVIEDTFLNKIQNTINNKQRNTKTVKTAHDENSGTPDKTDNVETTHRDIKDAQEKIDTQDSKNSTQLSDGASQKLSQNQNQSKTDIDQK